MDERFVAPCPRCTRRDQVWHLPDLFGFNHDRTHAEFQAPVGFARTLPVHGAGPMEQRLAPPRKPWRAAGHASAWHEQMARWRTLYYCAPCDQVFLPGRVPQIVAPEGLAAWLRAVPAPAGPDPAVRPAPRPPDPPPRGPAVPGTARPPIRAVPPRPAPPRPAPGGGAPLPAVPAVVQCPTCHIPLPVHPGYVTWCERCDWNLQPSGSAAPVAGTTRLYAGLGRRLSRHLYTTLLVAPALGPRLTPAILLAFLLAGGVHALTVALALLGGLLIGGNWGSWGIDGIGLLLLGLAWFVRPRFPQLAPDDRDRLVTRTQCPTLYQVTDRVCAALGTPPPAFIVIDSRYNAALSRVGWRWQPVLRLGLPLLAVLDPAEQVALLGHELAHAVNRDLTRSYVVGTALESLQTWYYVLQPDYEVARAGGCLDAVATLISRLLLLTVASGIRLLYSGLLHLLWRNTQRAEYLADSLAATVSGTAGVLGLLDKLPLHGAYRGAVQHIALTGHPQQLIAELRHRVATVPPRERARLHRVAVLEEARLDSTHPPTAWRINLLRARPVVQPPVTLDAAHAATLAGELAALEPRVAAEVLDQYANHLYE